MSYILYKTYFAQFKVGPARRKRVVTCVAQSRLNKSGSVGPQVVVRALLAPHVGVDV